MPTPPDAPLLRLRVTQRHRGGSIYTLRALLEDGVARYHLGETSPVGVDLVVALESHWRALARAQGWRLAVERRPT